MATRFVAGIGALLGKEVVGETIEGGFRVAAAGISAAGSAVGGALSGAGAALGGALQGAMTPAPTTVVNNVGIVGEAAKKKVTSGSGSLPAPKKKAAQSVNANMPTEKLLVIAVKYLSSIDKTLQDQINFERLAFQRQVQAEKEAAIENTGTSTFAGLGEKLGAVKDRAAEKTSGALSLAKKIIGGTALAGLGFLGLGMMTGEQSKLDELKQNWEAFQTEYKWLFQLGKYLGAAVAGGVVGGLPGALASIVLTYLGERGLFDSIPVLGDILGNRGDAEGGASSPPGAIGAGITAGLAGYAGYRGVKSFRDIRARANRMGQIRAAPRADPRLAGSGFRDPRTGRAVSRAAAASGGGWLSGPKGQRFVAFLARRFGRTYVARKIMPLLARVMVGVAVTATGVGAIPGAIWTLVNVGLSIWTVYDLIQAYWDWTDEEKARKDAVAANTATPTPDATAATGIPGAPRATAAEIANLPAIPADVEKILATIRTKESGGNYGIPHPIGMPGQSASGAYAFTNGTWQSLTKKYGIGTEYSSAYLAPPPIQDAVAARYVQEILQQAGGDVSKVPLAWYTGNIQGKMSASALATNNGLTPQAYQANWMQTYTGGQYSSSSYDTQGMTAGAAAGSAAAVTVEGMKSFGKFVKSMGRQLVGERQFVPMSSQTTNPDRARQIGGVTSEIERAMAFGKGKALKNDTGLSSIMNSLQTASPQGTIGTLDPNFNGGGSEQYLQYHKLAAPKAKAA